MRVAVLLALGAAGIFAAVALAGGPNDLKGSLTCSGKQCTLKVTNNSGQPQSSLNIGVGSGLKVVSAKSAGTLEVTVTPTGGKPVVAHAGECAVTNGGTLVGCTYETGSWANGASKSVSLTAAAAVAKGAAVNICPSNGGCRTVYFGAAPPSTSTTTTTAASAHPDLAGTVSGPDSVDLKGARVRLQYHVDIVNLGTKQAGTAKVYISADLLSGSKALPNITIVEGSTTVAPSCSHGRYGFACDLPSMAPHAKHGWVVTVSYATRKVTKDARAFRIGEHIEDLDRDDPFPNNNDTQETEIDR